jgi:protease PrsW
MPSPTPDDPNAAPLSLERGKEITGWRIKLYYWTRNPHVLFFAALIIIGTGIGLAHALRSEGARPPRGALLKELRRAAAAEGGVAGERDSVSLATELMRPAPDIQRVLGALDERRMESQAVVAQVGAALQESALQPLEKTLAIAYWTSLCSDSQEPGADLLFLAHQAQPPAHANERVGDLHANRPDATEKAARYYLRELAVRPGADDVRRKLVNLHWESGEFSVLAGLRADPSYASMFTNEMLVKVAVQQNQWSALWAPLIAMQKENFSQRIPVILTCVAGAVWLLLAWQMGQPRGLFSFRIWAPVVAIPLGMASTLPVLFLDVYQSEAWGLKHSGLFYEDCLFFVAGVGLREELCKLVFFLPFLPVLLARGNRLEMLLVAGCVGLGFAVEENVSYFRMAEPSNAFGRFLTANFLHFAATGLAGLALCDALRNFRTNWWKFPAVFAAVVLAHGFYDVFISVPMYVFIALGLSCFILLSLAFFRQVAAERGSATDQVFPAATLVVGLSVLVATIIVCAAGDYGLDFALSAVSSSAISLAVFVYMFFVLFRDGLAEEEEILDPTKML